MSEYHKIHSIYKRDEKTKRFLVGEFARPEFDYLQHAAWEFTEKVDGTNIRIYWDGDKVRIGGRTDNASIPTFLLQRLNDLFTVEKLRATFPQSSSSSVCLYGEGYGAKIQKGGGNYKADGVDFVLFDVRIDSWWLERPNVDGIGDALGIETVPVIGRGSLHDACDLVKGGLDSAWGPFAAEGIVARPLVSLFTRNGERIITKIKARDFEGWR